MKSTKGRVFLFISVITLVSGLTWALKAQTKSAEKKYTVTQSIEWWSHALNVLEAAKTQLKQSDLPSKNVVYMADSLMAPIQMEITKQVQDQLNAERAKTETKKDTTKTKKN